MNFKSKETFIFSKSTSLVSESIRTKKRFSRKKNMKWKKKTELEPLLQRLQIVTFSTTQVS